MAIVLYALPFRTTGGQGTSLAPTTKLPPTTSPVLVTAYMTECADPEAKRNAVLAEVGRLVVSSYDRNDPMLR